MFLFIRCFLQVWSIDGKKYKYSLVACVTTCLQEEVKSTCGCIMGFFAPSYTFTNLSITPYCLDMKEPFETISNRSKCMTEIARASVTKMCRLSSSLQRIRISQKLLLSKLAPKQPTDAILPQLHKGIIQCAEIFNV